MVDTVAGDEDRLVVDRTLVWAVRLGVGAQEDVEGYLSLDTDRGAVVFEAIEPDVGEAERVVGELAIPLTEVSRVRRVLGSPVLVVRHGEGAGRRETAFYFAKPPRLSTTLGCEEPPELDEPTFPLPRFGARRGGRRERRRAATYLGIKNRGLKEDIRAWRRTLEDAARDARGRPDGSPGA